jgi:hypothetical protein
MKHLQSKTVMPGLDPGIHASAGLAKVWLERVDGRIKSGHDDRGG